ncbi:tyrosine-type recombinase/integrase [Microlunatus sp. GCM10028923]|uniref:tyrosine-type recombinase/integrase n=1 Tax=Microlunatus sp. GCM10028923 TaxID=3273400 RepID=UPI00361F2F44
MAGATRQGSSRPKGSIERLPSGAIRVSVYAGIDPVTKRRHYLKETIPAGTPKLEKEAEKVKRRLQVQVDEQRQPRTSSSVSHLVERHLEMAQLDRTTLSRYQSCFTKHIAPLIGNVKVGAVDADLLDSFYAELGRCRLHCNRRAFTEHRTQLPHECDVRCKAHVCRPLAPSSIRQIHFILSGAFKRAVRWKWVATNPIASGEPPAATPPKPDPPSAAEAARILEDAFQDPAWGALVWLAMITGARRGELCALRWSKVDLAIGTVTFDASVGQANGETWLKDTKTHQHRRVALDQVTLEILRELRIESEARAMAVGAELSDSAFVFSLVPDSMSYRLPDSVGQRYERAVSRLGIDSTLHKLRHYSATELIAAGVDVRTVAGRLGHGGGGTTTLRVYTAFVSEADQRASEALQARVPQRPKPRVASATDQERADAERARLSPRAPFEHIAHRIVEAIRAGELPRGVPLPGTHELVRRFGSSANTLRRAVRLVVAWKYLNEQRVVQTKSVEP